MLLYQPVWTRVSSPPWKSSADGDKRLNKQASVCSSDKSQSLRNYSRHKCFKISSSNLMNFNSMFEKSAKATAKRSRVVVLLTDQRVLKTFPVVWLGALCSDHDPPTFGCSWWKVWRSLCCQAPTRPTALTSLPTTEARMWNLRSLTVCLCAGGFL